MFDRAQQSYVRFFGAAIAVIASFAIARAANVELPVPNITIYPGDVVGGEMLVMKTMRLRDETAPIVRTQEAAIGKVARRTLVAGRPIPTAYLTDPQVVRQGKSVQIVFSEGGLMISGVGIALQSGGVGDLISVRNADSGTVIRGIVEANGSVRIAGP
jgi:flagella basal body P-ring formation protein FlgA